MTTYKAIKSALIEAPAEQVYKIIADYKNGHPNILPKPYFISLEVEQGGYGAGTIINFKMRVAGSTQSFRARVTEPEPGRVLVETGLDQGGVVTTFFVRPANSGKHAEVTITTEGKTRKGGALGRVERFLTELILERIYKKELSMLASFARERSDGKGAGASSGV